MISIFFFFSKNPVYIHAKEVNRFRFAVMGCMHLGICDIEEFEKAVEEIKKYNPDFVLFLGGMVDCSGHQPAESLWNKYDSIVGKLGVPVYDVLSDCRLINLSVSQDRADSMERCFMDRYRHSFYSFEYKNNLFIGLNYGKHVDQTKDSVFQDQLNFLKNTVADIYHYDNVFIFMHGSPWFASDSRWSRIIHPLIEGRVKFVFGAEEHHLRIKKIGSVTYVRTGTPPCYSGVFELRPSFFNFLIAEVENTNVYVQIVAINPIPIENMGTLSDFKKTISEDSSYAVVKPTYLTSYERESFLKPDQVVGTLKIKPGMDILDIGAGTGFFTFRFADALEGTGRVFATEIDPKMIEYINNKIKEGGYKNVFPVCVESQIVDPFYKQHSFDLIFISESYHYLRSPEDYFRDLRASLKKEGRIYIIHTKNIYDFSEIEIGDFINLIKILKTKGEDYPVFKKLDEDLKYFIKNCQDEDIPPGIRIKIVKDLNKMLLDKWLLNDLMDYFADKGESCLEGEWSAPLYLFVPEDDIKVVKLLFVYLDADGVFDKREKTLTAKNKEQLRLLNKILLCDIFEIRRLREFQGDKQPVIYAEKKSVVSTMKKAGYQFVGEYDFLPIHHFLEFKKR